jgi:hypothetical protein
MPKPTTLFVGLMFRRTSSASRSPDTRSVVPASCTVKRDATAHSAGTTLRIFRIVRRGYRYAH